MTDRPYTLLSCSISLDGYLDAGGEERLVLSNPSDLRRVDEVRAWADAVLVGGATVRNDNPRLLVRDPVLRERRRSAGRPETPVKVTVTGSGLLDPRSNFFTIGGVDKIVYCPHRLAPAVRRRLDGVATVAEVPEPVDLADVLADLHHRGVARLMVEGGCQVLTQLLTEDLADELHVSVAPFFVGTSRGRRFVGDGDFPFHAGHRAALRDTVRIGDVVLLRYDLSDRAREGSLRSTA